MGWLVSKLSTALAPWLRQRLHARARRGKEDPARLSEREGISKIPRPKGRVLWVHAASVGEMRAALVFITDLLGQADTPHVLLTTGTVNAAKVLGTEASPRLTHQYAPADIPAWVTRFLDHWQPDAVVFMESELWPNTLAALKTRKIPALLANARLSRQSGQLWRLASPLIKNMLETFDAILAQNRTQARRFKRFTRGPEIVNITGNLKDDAPPLPVASEELTRLKNAIADRPIWLAASCHADEEALVLDIHHKLSDRLPGLLTVIAPRQPDRGPQLAEAADGRGLHSLRRSLGRLPLPGSDVYIADTLGELGLFYAAAPVCVMGKSLLARGGQNPAEAIAHGCAVTFGPHMENFADLADELVGTGGARLITRAHVDTVTACLTPLLESPELRKLQCTAARTCLDRRRGAKAATLAALAPLLAGAGHG